MTITRIILILFTALVCGRAPAANYYVSPSGLDSNAGTLGAPWLTIQNAVNTAVAGDTVCIRAGTYTQAVTISGRHGTSASPIVFKNYTGESAVIDLTSVTPPNGNSAVLLIQNSDYIIIQGLEIRNYKTASAAQTPAGIYITGACAGVQILQNKIHDIWQSNATRYNTNASAFGIAVYGNDATAIDGLVLSGNEVYNLRTGASESVTLNGNVTNFTVTNNLVHDNNNIGIDFIGFEGTNSNGALDQTRNGECSGNTVYNIDSAYNPAYGGSFTANPPNDAYRGAPGIYVDGGANIVIERNLVYTSNFGIEIGCETAGKSATGIAVRDNMLHHNHVGGIFIGGATSSNGGTQNCSFTNNTLYLNDTSGYGGGQFAVQNFVSGCTVSNNIMVCNSNTQQFILCTGTGINFAANAINWNFYSGAPVTSVEFIWNGTSQYTFANWKTASGQDANSFFNASPGFNNAAGNDFTLVSTSPAVNAGDPSFVAASGEKDFGGQSRIASARVDIGADEYMSAWQAWRDLYFSLPDGGPGANASDDPDHDGISNVMEYALNSNPTVASNGALPLPGISGGYLTLSFTRNLNATDLTYTVQASNDLSTWSAIATKAGAAAWSTTSGVTVNDPGTGSVIVTDSVVISGGSRRFLRLTVAQP